MSRWGEMSLSDYLAGEEASYGLPTRSGGHIWREDVLGRVCTGCGRRWAEVVGATKEAVSHTDWAHSGALLHGEQKEFADEVDWLWATIVEAAGQ